MPQSHTVLRLPIEKLLYDKLADIAANERRSVSKQATFVLEQFVIDALCKKASNQIKKESN